MAAQGERVSGVVDMDGGLADPMAQDEEVEQEMLVVEEHLFLSVCLSLSLSLSLSDHSPLPSISLQRRVVFASKE